MTIKGARTLQLVSVVCLSLTLLISAGLLLTQTWWLVWFTDEVTARQAPFVIPYDHMFLAVSRLIIAVWYLALIRKSDPRPLKELVILFSALLFALNGPMSLLISYLTTIVTIPQGVLYHMARSAVSSMLSTSTSFISVAGSMLMLLSLGGAYGKSRRTDDFTDNT